ncbi:hypothetical protein [Micavibrio aeruginosavorus]|uniref:hypothetical protein n=1 Tax=Micavibrio aeruginosavorus TaxID=349221 RepID=UPI003F4AB82B
MALKHILILLAAAATYLVAMAIIFATSAHAADAITYAVNLQDGLSALVTLVFASLSAATGAIIAFIFGRKKSAIKLDAEMQGNLALVIIGALKKAESRLQVRIQDIDDVAVKSQFVAAALNTILDTFPTVLKKIGVDHNTLLNLISAQIEKERSNGVV